MVTDLIASLNPDFEPTQLALPPEKYEPFRDRMLRRLQDRPAADWMRDCIANGSVVATTYQTTQDALRDPDIVANGHAIDRGDDSIQLGPLARMTKTPAQPGQPCQPDSGWTDRWQPIPDPVLVKRCWAAACGSTCVRNRGDHCYSGGLFSPIWGDV